ncbi:hypothetical protein [Phocicoccus pinnipedialis]|uniref:Uncharacterized protein n=1 Tax=Phocicoccus pinnipedialis TaxID=110845 RepID=A0A6V7R4V5_9BACL|nr:hypothetical protein [Jeotgalicoccus pinnipedialis]MBP1940014.1 hypothetical protein [Jeotgalicoccus pinnipedialis]CAD2072038.1 hypothetical protein JEOPIN946_00236 [Jeotgalicoccus pinnipedialis]
MYTIVDLSNEKNGYYTYQLKKDNKIVVLLRAHREREYGNSYILRVIDTTSMTDLSTVRTEWPVPYFMISKLLQELMKNNIKDDIYLIDTYDPRLVRIISDFNFELAYKNYFGSIEIDTLIHYLERQTKTHALMNYYPVTAYNKEPLIKKAMEVYESNFNIEDKNKLPYSYWEAQLANDLDMLNSVALYPTKTIRGYAFLYKVMYEVDIGHVFYDSLESKERVVSSLLASLRSMRGEIEEVFLNIRARDIYTSDLFKTLDKSEFFNQCVYKMKK